MAGIFERLVRPQMKAEQCDPKAMELQTAKEILAEVFGVKLAEVDEMILSRFEAAGNEDLQKLAVILDGMGYKKSADTIDSFRFDLWNYKSFPIDNTGEGSELRTAWRESTRS